MNADFKFDEKKFAESMERIRQLGALTSEEAVSKASRIAVRQAILTTPWPGRGKPKSLAQQYTAQKERVKKDVKRFFRVVSEMGIKDEQFARRLQKAMTSGDFKGADQMVDLIRPNNFLATLPRPYAKLHSDLRFKPRQKTFYVVENQEDRDAYAGSVLPRVFTMKAGWGRAAMGLGIKVNAGLKRLFPGQGGFKFARGEKPLAEFSNSAKGIGDTREADTIMRGAIYSASMRMAKELQQYLAAIGRGDFNGVRAKLQREKFVASSVE